MQHWPAEKRVPLPHEPITHFLPLSTSVKQSDGSLASYFSEDSFLHVIPMASDKSTTTTSSLGEDSDFCASSLRSQIDEKKLAFLNNTTNVDPCSSFFIVELAKSRREDPLEMWNGFLQRGQSRKPAARQPAPPAGSMTRRQAPSVRKR